MPLTLDLDLTLTRTRTRTRTLTRTLTLTLTLSLTRCLKAEHSFRDRVDAALASADATLVLFGPWCMHRVCAVHALCCPGAALHMLCLCCGVLWSAVRVLCMLCMHSHSPKSVLQRPTHSSPDSTFPNFPPPPPPFPPGTTTIVTTPGTALGLRRAGLR